MNVAESTWTVHHCVIVTAPKQMPIQYLCISFSEEIFYILHVLNLQKCDRLCENRTCRVKKKIELITNLKNTSNYLKMSY